MNLSPNSNEKEYIYPHIFTFVLKHNFLSTSGLKKGLWDQNVDVHKEPHCENHYCNFSVDYWLIVAVNSQ